MAKYNQLSYGSSGKEVEDLQNALNKAGNYNLDVDGQYGPATQNAVRDYQHQNGLDVDGIAGDQTLGKLYSVEQSPPAENQQTPTEALPTAPDYSKYQYDPSTDAAYQQALQALQQAQQQLPTYNGTYDQQLQDIYDQIVNREKFSYDINKDALYQQYADQYVQMGKMAAEDTMGKAAAMTGGYGNSYAQTVSQQAYQDYLRQLNEVVPELHAMAFDRYSQEGQDLLNQFAMLGDMKSDEYARYQDALNQYWQNVSYQKQLADDAYNQGYTTSRDQIADQQWQDSFDYQKQQDEQAQENWQKEYDFAVKQYTDSQNRSYSSSGVKSVDNGKIYIPEWINDALEAGGYTEDELYEMIDRWALQTGWTDDERFALGTQYRVLATDYARNGGDQGSGGGFMGAIAGLANTLTKPIIKIK